MKKDKPLRELLNNSLKRLLLILRFAVTFLILGILQANAVDAPKDRKFILAPDNSAKEKDMAAMTQQLTITGKVTDSKTGDVMPGVNILVKGTTMGVLTDAGGNFSITVSDPNTVLIISFIGYTTLEIPVSGRASIDIKLEPVITELEEVVVIGYGTMKKKDLTGSVASIKSELVEDQKPQAVQDILRGAIAGLEVGFGVDEDNGTDAKGGGEMEIRGVNTLKTESSPLIVLDGVIYPGAMSDINPNDIESIDVLKDASSSAVFGARAANGVILITTKKGRTGKAVINFNSSIGLATMAKVADVYGPYEFLKWRSDVMKANSMYNPALNDKLYIFDDPSNLPAGITEEMWRDGKTNELVDIWLSRLAMFPAAIQNYKDGKYIDWGDIVFQNGLRQDYNLSMSGKKDEVSYYWSAGYNNNEGIVVGDQFKTIRSRLNLDGKVTKWLDVGLNSQFANRDESSLPATWGAIETNDPWKTALNPDGSLFIGDDLPVGVRHPLYDQSFTTQRIFYNTLISSLYANVKLPLGITYQLTFAPRFEWMDNFRHRSALHQEWKAYNGEARRRERTIFSWQIDNLLKWNKVFNNVHQVDITLLANAEKYQSWYNTMTARGFSPTDALGYHNMGAGSSSTYTLSSEDNYSTGDALMARLFYSYLDKYMVTLSIRRDGYSAFGMGNPRGVFPAAALGWVFTNESWMPKDILTFGKLRFSWGENGNREVGRYAALSDMGTGKYPYTRLSGTTYENNRLYVNHMANYNLRWEKTRSINIGLDFGVKEDLITGSIDFYKMRTLDLLVDRVLPNVTGFASVTSNLGEVDNAGFEISLNAGIMNKQNFIWRSNFTFYLNRNKIVHLYGDMVDVLDESGNVIGEREGDDITNGWFIGHAIDQIWQPRILGVWQLGEEDAADVYGVFPGDFKIKDVNNDGKITILDNEFQGYRQPRFRWNMRHDFNIYKDFDLSFNLYSYWGHYDEFDEAKNNSNYPDRNNSYIYPYWTPENPLNNYARNFSGEGGADYNVWRKKSFIRLDNLTLTYTLPRTLLGKLNIANLKLIGTIRNVAVWAPEWVFWDPEFSGPNPRYLTLGINLTL